MDKFEEDVEREYASMLGASMRNYPTFYTLAELYLGAGNMREIRNSAEAVVRLRQDMDRRLAELDEGVK